MPHHYGRCVSLQSVSMFKKIVTAPSEIRLIIKSSLIKFSVVSR